MTDREFDVLDELYFVKSFQEVLEAMEIVESDLKECLEELIEKDWVRCMRSVSTQEKVERSDFEKLYSGCYYLATKKGLIAHNSI